MEVDHSALFDDLVRVEIALWNSADARVRADHDVPLSWVELMTMIAGTADCTVGDIARDLSITVGGTSKLVDRIELAQLCRRVPNPHDRRSHHIELTAAGRRLLRSARGTLANQLDRDLGSVSPARLREMAATLSDLRRAAADQDGAAHPAAG